MLDEVRAGLLRPQKEIPSKFFYDTRGSELFEEITRLPEYYLTRTERALLEACAPEWIAALHPRTLVELGAGSAVKTRILLDAMRSAGIGERYIPVDVSSEFLEGTAGELRGEYPALQIVPVVADMSAEFELPENLPRPALFALLGSTIGNFDTPEAIRLLRQVRRAMHSGDWLLLGVDLRKEPARIEAAYNDAQGITAEFNRNILRVVNRELEADFDPDAFRHRAFYNTELGRIEMHLEAEHAQVVSIPGMAPLRIRAGETIRTEISCKYDRASVQELFAASGLRIDGWHADAEALFALVIGVPVE
ncbi:L-histidine N(alpha)-methyltransferase [soil metagenome]